jgi:predicted acyltransferase
MTMRLDDQAPPATAPTPRSDRLLSIDALRGFDMLCIVGGDRLVLAWAAWSGSVTASDVARQFEHVDWEGFRFYDLIFPLFLFLVGAVLPFSLSKAAEQGKGAVSRRIGRRVLLLFALGLICNGVLQFDWENLRVTGVLQRIAICYGIAAVIVMNTSPRTQLLAGATILLGYWALLAGVAPPGGTAGDFTKEGNLAGWVDRHYLPGKILAPYYGFGDNEGLLSTIPAVATVLMGALSGAWLRSGRHNPRQKTIGLLLAGILSVGVGSLWGAWFPIIKNLLTSSFVLVAGGWSLILLAAFYSLIDVLRWRRWAFVLVVVGVNAITIYVVPRFLDFDRIARFFLGGVYTLSDRLIPGDFLPVAAATGTLLVQWLFLLYLYKRRLFLRV